MKKSISFNLPFHGYLPGYFTNNFAAIYMFLENITGDDSKCEKRDGKSCGDCEECRKSREDILEKIYFLFDTMSGGTSLRDRYDGEPSEMKKLVGDFEDYQFGTDYTVDFLFGFAGYEYRKLSDNAGFKDAVVKSINSDIPVIAKVKKGRFFVVTGYDEDDLISPNYNDEQQQSAEVPAYDELDVLYIFGDRIEPRYTLKDGLERIRQVMLCTVKENLWEQTIENMGWDWSNKPNLEERKARMNRIAGNMWATMICHNFAEVFRHRRYEELCNPALTEICARIGHIYGYMCSLAWGLICINDKIDWSFDEYADGMTRIVAMTLEKMKQVDIEVLDLINQAIEIISGG